jgi:flagellar protein FlbT
MPLKLDLKCGEKMIVNGAVMENVGPNAKVLIHNLATVLREKEILTQDDAATPASRVYFSLQCAYMFDDAREEHLKNFARYLKDYLQACPSASEIADVIKGHIEAENFYKALKSSRNLIAHEVRTLDEFNSGMNKLTEIAAEAEKDEAAMLDSDKQQNAGS